MLLMHAVDNIGYWAFRIYESTRFVSVEMLDENGPYFYLRYLGSRLRLTDMSADDCDWEFPTMDCALAAICKADSFAELREVLGPTRFQQQYNKAVADAPPYDPFEELEREQQRDAR